MKEVARELVKIAKLMTAGSESEEATLRLISIMKKQNEEYKDELRNIERAWGRNDYGTLRKMGLVDTDLERQLDQLEQERSDASSEDDMEQANHEIDLISEAISDKIKERIRSLGMLVRYNNEDIRDLQDMLTQRKRRKQW